MGLRLFLTADLHLGMKFANYPEVQSELSEARFTTFERLIEIANSQKCQLFVVAGDLFERVTLAKRDVIMAAQIISEFEGNLAVVLPGNHDYISPGQTNLWVVFSENASGNVVVLSQPKPYPLRHYDLDVTLYPAPCTAKHSDHNLLSWIKSEPKDPEIKYHIGIAHGSLEGVSLDFDQRYYPMTTAELLECGLDLWLIGHTHVQHPTTPGKFDKIFNPGTPEPDGLDCLHEGRAWILEVDEQKQIHAKSVSSGQYRFKRETLNIAKDTNIDDMHKRFDPSDYGQTVLHLKMTGRLPEDQYRNLGRLQEAIRQNVFYLQCDDSNVTREITHQDIDREFAEGSFPHILLSELSKRKDFEALQVAYEILQQAKQ